MFIEYFIIEFSFQVYEKNLDYFVHNYFLLIHKLSSNRKIEQNRNIRFSWFEYFERFGSDCNFYKPMS